MLNPTADATINYFFPWAASQSSDGPIAQTERLAILSCGVRMPGTWTPKSNTPLPSLCSSPASEALACRSAAAAPSVCSGLVCLDQVEN